MGNEKHILRPLSVRQGHGGSPSKGAMKSWRQIHEDIYDALDLIRFHPMIADYLNMRDDSVKWYKYSGRILERLVRKLLSATNPGTVSRKHRWRQAKRR